MLPFTAENEIAHIIYRYWSRMMDRWTDKKLWLEFALHGLFWVAVYHLFSYFLGYGGRDVEFVSRFTWFLMPTTVAICYFFYSYLIPKYLLQKRFRLFALYSVYTVIVAIQMIVLSIFYGLVYLMGPVSEDGAPLTRGLPFIIVGVLCVVFIFVFIVLVVEYYRSQQRHDELASKMMQAQLQLRDQELRYLKMQIHPHFLFNSLNTIYGYALTHREEAPDMIMRLSHLLDYILYKIDQRSVPLSQEIGHLEDYISLEQLRFFDTLDIDYQKEITDPNTAIAPMLLIPLVENAFKHGTPKNGKCEIIIRLTDSPDILHLFVKNTYNKNKAKGDGIGLENMKKRLELLYPDRHELSIMADDDYHIVELSITVNENKADAL